MMKTSTHNTQEEKEKIIFSRLSPKTQEAVLRDPKKQQEVTGIVRKIFKRYKKDISELSNS